MWFVVEQVLQIILFARLIFKMENGKLHFHHVKLNEFQKELSARCGAIIVIQGVY